MDALGGGFKTRVANKQIVTILTLVSAGEPRKELKLSYFASNGTSEKQFPAASTAATVYDALHVNSEQRISARWEIFDLQLAKLGGELYTVRELKLYKHQRIWHAYATKLFTSETSGDWSEANIKPYLAPASGKINQGEVKTSVVQFNRKESGTFNINHIKVLNGRTYTTDSEGNIRDDYVHGDAPNPEKLKAKRYNEAEIANLWANDKLSPDWSHEAELKALAFKADGSDGRAAVQHFIDGSGQDFVYSNETALAQEMQKTKQVKDFIDALEAYLKNKIDELKGALPTDKAMSASDLRKKKVTLPSFNWKSAIGTSADSSAIIIGGVQAASVKYNAEFGADKQLIKVKITKIIFYDCFGAGLDDAVGVKSLVPGFASFVALQHYSNKKKPNKYVPYTTIVNIEVK